MCPGRRFILEHWRGEERLDDLVNEESYAYDNPISYMWVFFIICFAFFLFGFLREQREKERKRLCASAQYTGTHCVSIRVCACVCILYIETRVVCVCDFGLEHKGDNEMGDRKRETERRNLYVG